MKIYISLPITGQEAYAREKANVIEEKLRDAGHEPINPFVITENLPRNPTYGELISKCLFHLIDEANAVLFCNGYRYSSGCRIEETAAMECGKTCYFEHNYDWLSQLVGEINGDIEEKEEERQKNMDENK